MSLFFYMNVKPFDLSQVNLEPQNEYWMPVSFNNNYEISDLGRLKHTCKNGNVKILKPNPNGTKRNYRYYQISGKRYSVQKLVLNHFIGQKPKGMYIQFIDNDTSNNALSNLRYNSVDNNHGKKGEKKAQSKLTETQVIYIRMLFSKYKVTMKDLSGMFGVSIPQIHHIIHRHHWTHI